MKRLMFLTVLLACALIISACGEKITVELPEDTKNYPESIPQIGVEVTITPESESTPEETLPESEAETIPETEEPLGYISPEGWYTPVFESIPVEGGGYNLYSEVMGLKVVKVQAALGIAHTGYYRQATVDTVAWYQSVNGLEPTGVVDLATWLKLGFSEEEWNTLGSYVTPVAVKRGDKRDVYIEKFIETARSYITTPTPFIVGASGKPGQGVDCSGLVLQCMYAIGVYPDGLSPVQHSTIEEYNSRLMWADPKLIEVSRDELIPGDLVFYRRPWSDTVCHVAIYIGDNTCIEALYTVVEELPLDKDASGFAIMGYKRVIAAEE